MAVHSAKPFRSQEIVASDRDSLPELSSSSAFVPLDAASAVSSLKDAIKAGYHGLDPTLEAITDVACVLTSASGAALAMWKDGAMVCRARSGELSPPLGAQLDAETGISGECLRTGKIQHCTDAESDPRVDAEACRSRGLRSIAVLPIQSTRETNGILLAFSTQPAAFTDSHVALLQQMAALAELARSAKMEGASSSAAGVAPGGNVSPLGGSATLASDPAQLVLNSLGLNSNVDQSQPPALPPELDRPLDVAPAQAAHRSRPIVLGAIALAVAALLTLAIWLGWRGPRGAESQARSRAPRSTGTAAANSATSDGTRTQLGAQHLPDNDPVWKLNPDGESLSGSGSTTSVGDSVKLARQMDEAASPAITASIIISDRVPRTQPQPPPASRPESHSELQPDPPTGSQPEVRANETASAEAPSLPPDSTPPSDANSNATSDANNVPSPRVTLPEPPVRLSQGVSGGQLLSSILPDYPASARRLRLEGEVVLEAMVMEDGTVGEVKVLKGSPLLAQSAVDAAKHWRYQPYQLNGQPVKNATKIVVEFTLPPAAATH
jgi:periplasmic protein TonB